jgi:hypothetical protein
VLVGACGGGWWPEPARQGGRGKTVKRGAFEGVCVSCPVLAVDPLALINQGPTSASASVVFSTPKSTARMPPVLFGGMV